MGYNPKNPIQLGECAPTYQCLLTDKWTWRVKCPKLGTREGKLREIFLRCTQRLSQVLNSFKRWRMMGTQMESWEKGIRHPKLLTTKINSCAEELRETLSGHRAAVLRKPGKGQPGWKIFPQVQEARAELDTKENSSVTQSHATWAVSVITHSSKIWELNSTAQEGSWNLQYSDTRSCWKESLDNDL